MISEPPVSSVPAIPNEGDILIARFDANTQGKGELSFESGDKLVFIEAVCQKICLSFHFWDSFSFVL